MELHDHMSRFRKRMIGAIMIPFGLSILLIYLVILKRNIYPQYLIPGIIGGFFATSLIIILLFIEFHRPDFTITQKYIVFSNLPPGYLLKKRFNLLIPFENIQQLIVRKDQMVFKLKDSDKYLIIRENQFDDYSKIKTTTIELAKSMNIDILP